MKRGGNRDKGREKPDAQDRQRNERNQRAQIGAFGAEPLLVNQASEAITSSSGALLTQTSTSLGTSATTSERPLPEAEHVPDENPNISVNNNTIQDQLIKITELTDTVLELRTGWQHKVRVLLDSLEHVKRCSEELITALELSRTPKEDKPKPTSRSPAIAGSSKQRAIPSTTKDTNDPLRERIANFRKQCGDLLEQGEAVTSDENALNKQDYRLREVQKSFIGQIRSGDLILGLDLPVLPRDLQIPGSHPEHTSVSDIDPLLRELYDRQGKLGIYVERLQELEFTYAEGKYEREFLRDRGDPVETTDEDFERNFSDRRRQIQRDLSIAQDECEMLRKRCEDARLDIDANRMSSPQPQFSTVPSSSQVFDVHNAVSSQVYRMASSLSHASGTGVRSMQHVSTWLQNIPPQELDLSRDTADEDIMPSGFDDKDSATM